MPSPTVVAQVTAPDAFLLLAFLLALAVGGLYSLWKFAVIQAFGSGGAPPVEKTNCPTCGARTPVGDERCEYCGEPLPDGGADVRDIQDHRDDRCEDDRGSELEVDRE